MYELSNFGKRFSAVSGIGELMDDLGEAVASGSNAILMGGGNPAHIAEVESVFREKMEAILDADGLFEKIIGNYDAPQGKEYFLRTIAEYFNEQYGWNITHKNIAVTNGSQNGFFYLFNMFSGSFPDGSRKKIVLPIVPEYIGYADQGLEGDVFTSYLPKITYTGKHRFKYMIDFDRLSIDHTTGAVCITRPTNPTGNVITDDEIRKLAEITSAHKVPLIIDNAYGEPFPGIIFTETTPLYTDNMILSYSLSKLGLPSLRTGIIIANEMLIRSLSNVNAVINLASGSFGQALAAPLFLDNAISHLSQEIIKPYYKRKSDEMIQYITGYFPDSIDYYIHESEGAFFLWLWFKGLPVTSYELYTRLKAKGVYVIPGHYFFPGIDQVEYRDECIRITFTGESAVIEKGIKIIADEIKELYGA